MEPYIFGIVILHNMENGRHKKIYKYRKIAEKLVQYDVMLFHGSAVAVDGIGYLFTAKSGTGKSTHTRLWREYFGDRGHIGHPARL